MDLNLEQYHDKIEQYETEFRVSPGLYKAKVFLFVMLGHCTLIGSLALNLGILAALFLWQNSGGPPVPIIAGYGIFGFLTLSTVKSLLVPLPLPSGMEISKPDFPYLYEVVESLKKPMKLKRGHIRILIDWEFNAYAFSRPAFGIIGPARHYIGFGLPLLASLNSDQVKAIMAHELAHYSRKHSSFSSRTGRMQLAWIDLLVRLNQNRITGLPYRAFFRWYVGRLSALTVVLTRNNEFEADKLAGKAVGKREMAQALMRTALRGELVVNEHWREIWRNALIDEVPVDKAISRLLTRLERESLNREDALEELRWRLGDKTEFYDSHPSLSDRLAKLGVKVPDPKDEPTRIIGEWSLMRPESTLQKFLGKHKRDTTLFLDEVWFHVIRPEWLMYHTQSIPLTALMKEIDKEWREKGRISAEKAWKRAHITDLFYGTKSTLPIVDYILKIDESHAHANFIKGQQLLREFDSLGILHIEKAIEKDPISYQQRGLALLSDYYQRMGSSQDYREAKYESFAAAEETEKAIRERSRKIRGFDTFEAHDIPEHEVREMVESFEMYPGIRRVHLVARQARHLPESRDYVFVIVPTFFGRLALRSKNASFTERFIFSRHHHLVILTFSQQILRWKIRKIENSMIYRKKFFQKPPKKEAPKEAPPAEMP